MADLKSVQITATGTVYTGRARLKKLVFVDTASAGTVTVRDGGASGTTRLILTTPAAAGFRDVDIADAGDGLLFETDMHITLSNVTSLTAIFE